MASRFLTVNKFLLLGFLAFSRIKCSCSFGVNAFNSFGCNPRPSQIQHYNFASRLGVIHSDFLEDEEELKFLTTQEFDDRPKDTDWWQAELTLLNAPAEPHPNLSAETVAVNCIRSLQWVDYPTPLFGLKRCYNFFTYGCREIVTARRGGKTVDSFVQYGLLAPALQPFMGAARVDIGNCTLTPAKPPLRGALASFPVQIYGAPVLAVQHLSGMERNGVAQEPPVTHMVIRLEQQRRPPNQGCWLVYELLDVRHAFAGDMGNVHVGG